MVGTGVGGSVIIQQLPQARVFNSAAITLTTGVAAALTFDSERYDLVPTGLTEQHSTSANTGRLTCRVAGLYEIGASVEFVANATGFRQAFLRLNGATPIAASLILAGSATVGTQLNVGCDYRLAVGDFLELVAQQGSGGNLNVTTAGNYSPEFWFSWRSP